MAHQHHIRQMADMHCPCPEVQLGRHATQLITLADNTAQHANAETAQVSWVYTDKSAGALLPMILLQALSSSQSSHSRSVACACSCTQGKLICLPRTVLKSIMIQEYVSVF